jgi:hypothetical protein
MTRATLTGSLVLAVIGLGARPQKPDVGFGASGVRQLRFTQRSPHSSIEEVMGRTEVDFFDPFTRRYIRREATEELFDRQKVHWKYNLADEVFDIFVPASYQRGVPHGLLVWLGGCDVPQAWLDALARHKLILIVARSGADHVSIVREALALDAVHNMKQRFAIDESRVYVAGFGSGAQIAAWMVRGWPDVFGGGIFLMGGWFYKANLAYTDWYFAKSDREDRWYPDALTASPDWKTVAGWPLERIRNEKRLVLMRGGSDDSYVNGQNWIRDDRIQYEGLLLDGFTRAAYIEVPGLGHSPPDGQWFEKGLAALEAEPKTPPTTAPTADPNPSQSQIDQSKRLLTTAQHGGPDERIRSLLNQVLTDYPTTPSAALAKKGLDWMDGKGRR